MAMMVNMGTQGVLFACGREANPVDPRIRITSEGGAYRVDTPYNANFVTQLKTFIPGTARKWDMNSKVWFVASSYGNELKKVIDECYKTDITLPQIISDKENSFEITFRADYVANCKGEYSNVHANGNWNAKIPEKVLREWFKQADAGSDTLYGLLGCDEKAKDGEIKKAYYRAARVWHPDVCREDNAREMFERIKEAYDVLSNQESRNKYNAGLLFERMAKHQPRSHRHVTYIPMMRCGDLRVIARKELGQIIVEQILEWRDITNDHGQLMVSYWDGDSFSLMWV